MPIHFHALIWAAAIICVAIASRAGIIAEDLAIFLILVLPVAGWLAINRRGTTCRTAKG